MLRTAREKTLALIAAPTAFLALLCPDAVSGQDRLAQPIVAPLPDSTSYVVQRDLVYRERDGRRLLLDAFVPAPADDAPFPAVVFIHGGPLPRSVLEQGKDLGAFQSFAPYVTEVGLGAVVFSNGFSGLGAFQTAREDVEAALAYIRTNAAKLSLDPERICLVHMSAGGTFLAPFLESSPRWLRCVVLYYAVLRPETFEALGAGAVSVDQRKGLDPFVHLEATDGPPTLFIAEAGGDAPVINADLRRFRDEAIEAGWSVEYWNHPAGPHGFDTFDPSPRSRSILERTRRFLREQLVSN